jgi:hypothetical protein
MLLDQPLRSSYLPLAHGEVVRQLDVRLKPKLRLAIWAEDMNVATRFLTGEKVEPELPFTKHRRAHYLAIVPPPDLTGT